MPLIMIVTIAIYVIAILWAWKSMGYIERNKKVAVIAIGIIAMYFLTWITFSISTKGVNYENAEMLKTVSKTIISTFAGINCIIVLPYVGQILDKVNEDEIEKETFSKKILTILVILVIILWFECGYMKDTQEGILQIYNAMK